MKYSELATVVEELRESEELKDKKLTKKDMRFILDSVLSTMADAVVDEGELSVPDLGIFRVKDRAEKKGRNPKTGEELIIPANRVVKFSPSKKLKDRVSLD